MIVWHDALAQVFYLKNNPQALRMLQQARLPDGMASIIRLASDSGKLLEDAAYELKIDKSVLQTAVTDYLIGTCLFPSSDARRLLGLNDNDSFEQAREHYRLLLKWLHPDKNQYHKDYAERVNRAWAKIKAREMGNGQFSPVPVSVNPLHEHRQPPTSRFPLFVLGLIGLAILLLGVAFLPDNTAYISGEDPMNQASEMANAKEILAVLPLQKINPLGTDVTPSKPVQLAVKSEHAIATKAENAMAMHSANITQSKDSTLRSNRLEIKQEANVEASLDHQNETTAAATIQEPIQAPIDVARENAAIISVEQGKQFLNDYAQRYQNGDIRAFMQLFSTNAQGDRGGRIVLEQEYGNFFNDTLKREIHFSESKFIPKQSAMHVYTTYKTSMGWHKMWDKMRYTNHSDGEIELILIDDNGRLLIQKIVVKE